MLTRNPSLKRSLNLLWGHQVVSQEVQFIWKPWLPRGMVIVLDGDPGVGKSSLIMDLVARITNGKPFPGETEPHEPGIAMIVPMEDSIDSIAKPRFEAAGGDLKRVAFFGGVKEDDGTGELEAVLQLPRDLELIADLCRQQRPAIVVIDPFFAVLGVDENGRYVMANDDQSVRQLFIRLKRLAEETGVLFVLIRHLNKGGHGNAVVRGAGSIGISASARAVLLAARDPCDVKGCLLTMAKTNISEPCRSRRYKVVGKGASSIVEWGDVCDVTANDLISPAATARYEELALMLAKDFLETVLEHGSKTWKDLVTLADKESISEITLRRARDAIGLEKKHVGKNGVTWKLPYRPPPIDAVWD
jgi:AAA domain